jgi:hypothetical protein
MKIALWILCHILAVGVGYWLIALPSTRVETTPNRLTKRPQLLLANSIQATAAPLSEIEKRLAALTPENWANELNAIATLPIADLPSALRGLLRGRFPEVRRRLIRAVFERWTQLDRPAALDAITRISSPQMKATALAAILSDWVKSDQEAAWQWVAQLAHDSVLQEVGVMELLSLSAKQDLDHYRTWALQVDEPLLRSKLLWRLANQWVQKDPEEAFEAALHEDDSVLRKALLDSTFNHTRQAKTTDWPFLLDRLLQLPDQADRIEQITQRWMPAFIENSSAAASAWVITHSQRPELQRPAAMLGSVLGGEAETVASLLQYGFRLKLGPLRDAFFANAAAGWASAKKPIAGTQELLNQCGPCLEREEATTIIHQLSHPPSSGRN